MEIELKRLAQADFYKKGMSEPTGMSFKAADDLEWLDQEIKILRVKIKELVESDGNLDDLLHTAAILTRMVKTRFEMTKEKKATFKEAVEHVIKDIAIPIGITALKK